MGPMSYLARPLLTLAAVVTVCGCSGAPVARSDDSRAMFRVVEWSRSHTPELGDDNVDCMLLTNARDEQLRELARYVKLTITVLVIRREWMGSSNDGNFATDEGLKSLESGPSILSIELINQEGISASGLQKLLQTQPTLQRVTLVNCSRMGLAAIDRLTTEYPSVTFHVIVPSQPLPPSDSSTETEAPRD